MTYQQLNADRNEIRLITILSPDAHPDEEDTIYCTLENVSLDDFTPEYKEFIHTADVALRRDLLLEKWIQNRQDAFGLSRGDRLPLTIVGRYAWTDYIALSYTWGDLGTTETIVLNGQRFEITRNLYLALHQLRASKFFAAGMKLWVDAICINQKNIQERSLQVQRMRDIYIQAFHTFAWLGPEEDDSARAITLLDLLAKGHGMVKVTMPSQSDPLTADEAALWISLYKFLDRPYWRRVWILQELAVSFSTVDIFCGQARLSLSDLADAARTMSESFLAIKENIRAAHRLVGLPEPLLSVRIFLSRIMELNLPFLDMTKSKDRHILPILFDLSRTSEQTDLKDKLYAILGLLDRDIVKHITPDYELPLWKVFASFPKAMITATDRLDILRQCILGDTDDPSMPSWVPDLTTVIHTNDISNIVTFNASGDTPAIFQFINDDRGLIVAGFRIDAIDGLGCTFWDIIGSQSSITPPSTVSNAYDTEYAARKALYRSLIMAGKEEVEDGESTDWEQLLDIPSSVPSWYNEKLQKKHESIREFLTLNKGLQVLGHELEEWLSSDKDHTSEPSAAPQIEKFYSRLLTVQSSRRLMTTAQGRIGVAPKAAKQGDIICIFFGSTVPMAVRPIPDFEHTFFLVGECYVEGMMDGDALGLVANNLSPLERFVLC